MKWTKEIYRSKLIDIFSLFLVGGFIGWLYEVILHLVMDGSFVNRGMLHGPWLSAFLCAVARNEKDVLYASTKTC